MRTGYRGYWIERHGPRCWDAYMPVFDFHRIGDRSGGDCWSSPGHKTRAAARAAISCEIRRVNAEVTRALAQRAET